MEAATTQLQKAIDVLVAASPQQLADSDTITDLHRQLDRLSALTVRSTAAFDAGRAWESDGARSGAAWISTTRHLPAAVARRQLYLGRSLRDMAVVEEAWMAGEVNDAHAGLLARAQHQVPDAFARDEALLVDYARKHRFSHFVRLLAYWLQEVDRDEAENETDKALDGRRLHLSQSFRGRWFADGVFDPIGGEIISNELRRIEDELFAADWAEAKAQVGEDVCVADLARTPAQRRADALVEMARRSRAAAPGSRLPEPLFTVFVDYSTFAGRICELASGTVVSPGAVVPWLEQGWVERVVFDGPDRIKNIGVRRRIFTGATRRAVEVRDRQCFHEFCEESADHCEIDHIEPYAEGGLTTDGNGRCACGFHNRGRNRGP